MDEEYEGNAGNEGDPNIAAPEGNAGTEGDPEGIEGESEDSDCMMVEAPACHKKHTFERHAGQQQLGSYEYPHVK